MLQKHDPVRVSVASGPPTCGFALCFGRVIILSPLLIPGPLPVAAQNAGGKAGTARVTEAVTVNSLPGPPSDNDGATNAPAGIPQLPNLLNDYALRPPWKVAGVDYAVGVPSGTALKDPTTISMPGVSINTNRHIIFVTGSNVTLNGHDFSLHGGWSVYIERGTSGTVIENSNFLVGANNLVPISAESGAGNLTVEYCTIDGGGFGIAGNPGAIYALISYNGSGGLTVEYDWLKNAPQHIIEFRNGTLIDQYNLIQNAGYAVGAHVNDVQFNGSVSDGSVIGFNTVFNPQPVNGYPIPGEGIQVEAQLGSTITHTRVENNTIIATGPSLTASYLIVIRQDAGTNVIDGVDIHGNYLDTTGAYGPFYPPTGSNVTFTDNWNMVTGSPFPSPPAASEQRQR